MSSHEIGHFQGNNFSINETHQICTSSKQESLSYHSFLLEFCSFFSFYFRRCDVWIFKRNTFVVRSDHLIRYNQIRMEIFYFHLNCTRDVISSNLKYTFSTAPYSSSIFLSDS